MRIACSDVETEVRRVCSSVVTLLWSAGSANDIILVLQPDGTLRCSPVNVQFRQQKDVANWNERIVTVAINGRTLKPKFSLNELRDEGSGYASSCLQKVKLPQEVNNITFTIRLKGEDVQVHAHLFLWRWNSRIVVVDLDGTITKSDIWGIMLPLFGIDWTHDGACHLFSAIHENGYKMIYLSARPKYLAESTRKFLSGLKQDDKGLPKGAVIVSPAGMIAAISREVRGAQGEDFKTPMLKEIWKLFAPGNGANPFHAGFGNRTSDGRTYSELQILCKRIFQIVNDSKGGLEVKCKEEVLCIFPGGYHGLSKLVDVYFPRVQECAAPHQGSLKTFAREAKKYFQKSKLWQLLHAH